MKRKSSKDPNRYPQGWDRKKVEAVMHHYETQSDDDAIVEAEAAYRAIRTTMMPVPVELVPRVQKLIAKRAG